METCLLFKESELPKLLKHFKAERRKAKKMAAERRKAEELAAERLQAKKLEEGFGSQVFLDASRGIISMQYSFQPQPKYPRGRRFKEVGSIVYTVDGRARGCPYSKDKEVANVMEQAKERFNLTVEKLRQIQAEGDSEPV
jgi:hypothetical protein